MRSRLALSQFVLALVLATPMAVIYVCATMRMALAGIAGCRFDFESPVYHENPYNPSSPPRKYCAPTRNDWLLYKGWNESHSGNFLEALKLLRKAATNYQQSNYKKGEGKAFANLGWVYYALGRYDAAIQAYQHALKIQRQIGDREIWGESFSLGGLGLVYYALGDYKRAINFYEKALAIARSMNDRQIIAYSLTDLGSAYQALGQYEKAIESHQKAISMGTPQYEAYPYIGLGQAYLSIGKTQQAIEVYNRALLITEQKKDSFGRVRVLNGLGKAYQDAKEYERAEYFYRESLAIAQKIEDLSGKGYSLNHLGDIYAQQNQLELAIVFYKQSVNVRETIRQDIRKLDRTLQESYTQSVAGTYRALADLLITQGRIGEAQQVLERLKLKELNDFTKGTRAPTAIAEVGFNPVETEIKGKYTSLVAFGGKFYECEQQQPRCAQYSTLKTEYESLSTEFQAFVEQIKQQLRESRLTQVNESTQDFLNSADRVVTAHPNSILIYPLVLADKTRILWSSKGGVLSKTAVCPLGEKALYDKVAEFQSLISKQGDETQLKAVGKDLYDCLVKPVESELSANGIQHLIFVPDRATNYLPMGALFDGKQYLTQRFAISNILSASLTDTDSKLTAPQTTSILALGLSEARGNYNALPNVEAELNAIVKQAHNPGIYPGQIFLNQTFTKDAFENNIRGHKIIHIATHGEFKPENPRSSYFLLGDGTPYPIPNVQTLRDLKDVHLVVLSACKTGLGGVDGLGLEVSGISSFFMGDRDRAKAVMASLWDVNDASTSLLMQQFYQNLALGKMTKVEALRQAQLSLLQEKVNARDAAALARAGARRYVPGQRSVDSLAHPYYWAPFILIGNGL